MTPPPRRFPHVESRVVTFRWEGSGGAPVVVGSWCGWNASRGTRMHPVDGGWEAHLELPANAYVEYELLVDGRPTADPLNRDRTNNGVGGSNQQLWMPGATRRATDLARRRVPRGTVTRGTIDLEFFAATPRVRRCAFYLPAGADADADARHSLPLLVVLDGMDYLRRGRLARILDALIAAKLIEPVAAIFLDSAHANRLVEYAANDFTVSTLADVVVPETVQRLGLAPQRVADGAGRAGILGSSLGGLMALHAGLRRPDVFGRVIAQSTSVMYDDLSAGEGRLSRVRLTTLDLMSLAEPPPIRLWLDVGDLEELAPSNDRLAPLLAARGIDMEYRRFPGGHDHTSWGESLVDALPWIFPARP